MNATFGSNLATMVHLPTSHHNLLVDSQKDAQHITFNFCVANVPVSFIVGGSIQAKEKQKGPCAFKSGEDTCWLPQRPMSIVCIKKIVPIWSVSDSLGISQMYRK